MKKLLLAAIFLLFAAPASPGVSQTVKGSNEIPVWMLTTLVKTICQFPNKCDVEYLNNELYVILWHAKPHPEKLQKAWMPKDKDGKEGVTVYILHVHAGSI